MATVRSTGQTGMAEERSTGLRIDALSIHHADGRLLLAISAEIAPGEVLSVMGPSGIGKSTLLAWLAGHLDPAFRAEGTLYLDGGDITRLSPQLRRAGMLFQDPLLFPHMTVGENLLFALPPRLEGRDLRRRAVEQALAEIGLSGFADRDPDSLSGGQRARVALQRVLLSGPRYLLLDEPFTGLDLALRGEMRDLVFARARERGLPSVLVTHDPADAEAAAGPVIDIGGGSR